MVCLEPSNKKQENQIKNDHLEAMLRPPDALDFTHSFWDSHSSATPSISLKVKPPQITAHILYYQQPSDQTQDNCQTTDLT